VVRLGQGVDKNRGFHPDAMARTLRCLTGYAADVRKHGGDPARAVCAATSQARDARDSVDFFRKVEAETGFRFKIISGDEEARLTFLGGLLPGMIPDRTTIIDIGGGSTEFISTSGGQSLDIGSVRFTERYFKADPVSDAEFWKAQAEIDHKLEGLVEWRRSLPAQVQLVGVAGTMTTAVACHLELPQFDAVKLDGFVLTRGDIHRLVEELKWRTVAEKEKMPGMESGRADVLLAGMLILWRAMECLDFKEVACSTRGLRFGLLR